MSTRICIPCLSPRSLGGKNTAISLGRCTERLTSVIRRCGRLTRLSVVRPRLSFFPFPCFPTSCLLRVFLNGKWDMSDEKLTKIWPAPDGNSGFCDYIFRIPPHAIKIYLQVDFFIFLTRLFVFCFFNIHTQYVYWLVCGYFIF